MNVKRRKVGRVPEKSGSKNYEQSEGGRIVSGTIQVGDWSARVIQVPR